MGYGVVLGVLSLWVHFEVLEAVLRVFDGLGPLSQYSLDASLRVSRGSLRGLSANLSASGRRKSLT